MASNFFFDSDSQYELGQQSLDDEPPLHQLQSRLDELELQQSPLPPIPASEANSSAPPPAGKPYHSKRPHKKSRTGCRNCKARKVKCDEARPTCRSCKLRKVECTYPTPAASSSSSSPSPAAASAVTPASPTPSASPDAFSSPSSGVVSRQQSPALNGGSPTLAQPLWRPGNIDSVDMKLLWFYTTTTSASFSVSDPSYGSPINDILRIRMVQIAFETPFLMDSLFALSSLHMQSINQDCDPSRALAYRARSFEGYRRAVESASPDTYSALIANSLFLTALSSQVFREEDSKELYILDWMIVWRGIGLVIDLISVEHLFNTGLYALFQRPPINLETSTTFIPNHLLFMVSSIKPDDPDYKDITTYHETLKYLGSLYMNLHKDTSPIMGLRIITWFTFLPRGFVELGRQRRPRALVIIAYYAAFLKLVGYIWWLKDVGQRSLTDICNYLGSAWEHLLHVPKAAMDADGELEVARILLQDPNWVAPEQCDDHQDSAAAVTMVNNAGRRVAWTSPFERSIVVLDSDPPKSGVWNG